MKLDFNEPRQLLKKMISGFFKSNFFIFILFFLIFFSFFRYTQSIDMGFDYLEDQLIVKTVDSLNTSSYFSVLGNMTASDIRDGARFRPFWVFYFVTNLKILGDDLLLINLMSILICIFTAFFLYLFCFTSGFTKTESVIFPLLILIGPVTSMYVRRTDVEIIGMLMLSVSLFFLSKSIFSDKRNNLYSWCFVISLLLTSICKENFIGVIPAVLFLYLWLYSFKHNSSIVSSIKKNYVTVIFILSMMFVTALTLVMSVGIDSSARYSGIKSDLISAGTLIDFSQLLIKTHLFLMLIPGIILFLLCLFKNKDLSEKKSESPIKIFYYSIVFMLLVIVPQYLVYSKTGFLGGRYYVPYLMGFAFMIIILLREMNVQNSWNKSAKYIYIALIIIFLGFELKTSAAEPVTAYRIDCNNFTKVLKTVSQFPDDELLIVMDPVQNYAEVYSFRVYLDHFKSNKNLKYDFIKSGFLHPIYADTSFYNMFLQGSEYFLSSAKIDSSKENSEIKNILILSNLNYRFLEKNKLWFDTDKFRKEQIGRYVIYERNF